MTIEQILEDFSYLDDWEDRYRYVIELGKALPEFSEAERTPANKVEGCVSQVWLKTREQDKEGRRVLVFTGDSDAHIVRGLIAILFAIYSGRTPEEIARTDAADIMNRLGLKDHLTQQRSNGLHAMIERIRAEANAAAAA
ncbi:MAG: SufE family protein [Flavobacteriaceae bacterium]